MMKITDSICSRLDKDGTFVNLKGVHFLEYNDELQKYKRIDSINRFLSLNI